MKATTVKGKLFDNQTRCLHYHSDLDIIAIKFKCCNTYYPCYQCHEEEANHAPMVWQKDELETVAILCGVCQTEMTIDAYLDSNAACPHCRSDFNPKCANHYHLYFEL
jgi:uncharacterized CHY-type Zn-finger protein